MRFVDGADDKTVRALAAHRSRPVDVVANAMSKIGRGGLLWTFAVAAAAARGRGVTGAARNAVPVAGAFVASAAVARLVGRRRPFETLAGVSALGERPSGPSFPSDQAASAAAAACQLSQLVPRGRRYFWSAALATSGSRVYVGAHYPSDIVAGLGLGVAAARVWQRLTG